MVSDRVQELMKTYRRCAIEFGECYDQPWSARGKSFERMEKAARDLEGYVSVVEAKLEEMIRFVHTGEF